MAAWCVCGRQQGGAGHGVGAFSAPVFIRRLPMWNQNRRKITSSISIHHQLQMVMYRLYLQTPERLNSVVYFIGWLVSR